MRAVCLAFVAGAWVQQQQAALVDARWTCLSAFVACLVAGAAHRALRRLSRAAPGRGHANDAHPGAIDGPRHGEKGRGRRRLALSATFAPFALAAFRAAPASVASVARRIAVVVAAFAIGLGSASWRAEVRLADALPHALEGRDLQVVGTIASLPSSDAQGTRFEFTVESVVSRDVDGRPLPVPAHLALGWYRVGRGVASGDGGVPPLHPGQRWRLTVRLKRPHGAANPNGFDYEYWLLENGLRATGYVRPGRPGDEGASLDPSDGDEPVEPRIDAGTRKLDEFVWTPGHVVERTRDRLRDRIVTVLADGGSLREQAPYAGVIVALVVGDQRAIPQSDWTVFNRTGIGHLVSISGLHVSMLAALGAWIVFGVWRRHPAWTGRLAAHKAAALAGALTAFVYCLLAGWGVPAQRTLYMISVVALALWMQRFHSPSRVLCLALATVVALDPWAVTGSGFWLSFAAVASIFYVTAGRLRATRADDPRSRRLLQAARTAVRVQWAVTLALTPLTLLFFYQVSVLSPLANAVAIPLVSFVVTPLSLAGAALPGFLGAWLLHAAHGLVSLLALWLQWLSGSRLAVWTGPAPGPVAFICAMVGVAWWLAPRGLRHRWAGALWMVPLFAWPPDRPAVGDVRFTALDIGQGTSMLIETHAANVLFDTGPSYSPDNDAGNRIIVPFLRALGINRLDAMIVSHNDNDHSGGALSILAALEVDLVRSSLAYETPIVRTAPRHVRCMPGQAWTVDRVRFALLAPPPEIYVDPGGKALSKANARSCVLRVEADGRVMLLTADIEKPQEASLVERQRDAIACDAMLVPHHGSRTSSTDAFLDATRPALAIVQAGYLNRFGHPRPDVLARYDARGIAVLRNDRDGAITVTFRSGRIDVERFRVAHRRYWYAD